MQVVFIVQRRLLVLTYWPTCRLCLEMTRCLMISVVEFWSKNPDSVVDEDVSVQLLLL